jgi:hypothetical protein
MRLICGTRLQDERVDAEPAPSGPMCSQPLNGAPSAPSDRFPTEPRIRASTVIRPFREPLLTDGLAAEPSHRRA